jgi:hypothetical protein
MTRTYSSSDSAVLTKAEIAPFLRFKPRAFNELDAPQAHSVLQASERRSPVSEGPTPRVPRKV